MKYQHHALAVSSLLFFALAGGAQAISAKVEMPLSADSFVDSAGINIHLHNGDTPYGNFPVIAAALRDLGIRHTRDGLIPTTWQDYYQHHSQLAKIGITCDFITGPERTNEEIVQFVRHLPTAVESLEGPNEYDKAGDPAWAAKLTEYMPRLHRVAQDALPAGAIRVIGPSLIDLKAYRAVSEIDSSFDRSNLHNYFGGHNPGTSGWGENGYGSIDWNLAQARQEWGEKPVVTTETGYLSDPHQEQGVGEPAQAAYLPRVLFEQKLHGIERTYLYELSDGNQMVPPAERSFGILRSDGSRKPAFFALQRLLHLLSDPGPAFHVQPVHLKWIDPPPDLHHLLLQKRDGGFYLAFWLERPFSDEEKGAAEYRQPLPFAVAFGRAIIRPRIVSLDAERSSASTPVVVNGDRKIFLSPRDTVTIVNFKLR